RKTKQAGLKKMLQNDIKVQWKRSEVQFQFPSREGQCCCGVENKLYIFGGVLQGEGMDLVESNDLLCFEKDKNLWEKVEAKGSPPPPRISGSLVAVGRRVYLFGGLSHTSGWLNDLYVYDIDTSTWCQVEYKGSCPSARDKLQGCAVGKSIYYFGGFGPKQNDLMDDDEEWEDEEDEEDLPDQEAAAFGWFNDLFVFDTETSTWSQPMQLNLGVPSARAAHGMCAVDNCLVIFGGKDMEGRQNDIHIFDTVSRKWKTDLVMKGKPPTPRSFHTTTAVGKRVVIIGGRGQDDQHLSDFEIFDLETQEWLQPKVTGDVPSGRGQHSVAVVGDCLILHGGTSNFNKEIMQCQEFHSDTYYINSVDEIFLPSHIRRFYSYRSSNISHLFGMMNTKVNSDDIFIRDNITYSGSKQNTCESTYFDNRFLASIIINAVTCSPSILPVTLQSIEKFTDKNSLAKIVICSTRRKFDMFNKFRNESGFSSLFEWIVLEESSDDMFVLAEGAKAAADSGSIVYVDDMTIFSEGWLTPLLTIVGNDSSVIAQPSLDILTTKSAENPGGDVPVARYRGITDWRLRFVLVNNMFDHGSAPYSSPMLMNHVFVLSKDLCDDFMNFYRNNNAWPMSRMELSFYSWMCGHRIMVSPCSRAGRLADINDGPGFPQRNQAARFWLGDYKKYFDIANHVTAEEDGYGSLSENEFSSLGCRTIEWFIKGFSSGLEKPPHGAMVFGKMRSPQNICVGYNIRKNKHLLLVPCNSAETVNIGVTDDGLLKMGGQCLFAYRTYIQPRNCSEQDLGEWAYTSEQTLRWYDNRCITVMVAKHSDPELRLHPCIKKMRDFATWTFDYSIPLEAT
ncbi:hypothetical protein FSP39_005475, partial [Pinctada imbricata]